MNRIAITSIFVTIMVASAFVGVFAKENHHLSHEKCNNPDVINTYRIDFQEGIVYDSDTTVRNIHNMADWLEEIVFFVDAGDDVFTIGCYIGSDGISVEELFCKVEKTVAEANKLVKNEERVSSNNNLFLGNLYLKYCLVKLPGDISCDALSLTGVSSYRRVSATPTKDELTDHRELTEIENKNRLRSYAINGSYHHVEVMFDYTYRCWYNQLTGTHNMCMPTLTDPHGGDGNNRYASGYQWFPNIVNVYFYSDVDPNINRTMLWYNYNQSTLNNLNVDSNEALEIEVAFYNYNQSSTPYNERGNAFQLIDSGSMWFTNQPNNYRDTNFCDSNQIVTFCVGVDDTSDLVANKWYVWYIDGIKGITSNNYPNDGRFRVTAQRSYRLLGGGTWNVFADEHEPIRFLGINNSQNWVPASQNAWTYAAAHDDWNFNSSTDPVK